MSDRLKELQERDTAKKPESVMCHKDFSGKVYKITGQCPVCQNEVYSKMKFCDQCGQELDWKMAILKARYENTCIDQKNMIDFFTDIKRDGYTLENLKEALSPNQYQYAEAFMKVHDIKLTAQ